MPTAELGGFGQILDERLHRSDETWPVPQCLRVEPVGPRPAKAGEHISRAVVAECRAPTMVLPAVELDSQLERGESDVEDIAHESVELHSMVGNPSRDAGTAQQLVRLQL